MLEFPGWLFCVIKMLIFKWSQSLCRRTFEHCLRFSHKSQPRSDSIHPTERFLFPYPHSNLIQGPEKEKKNDYLFFFNLILRSCYLTSKCFFLTTQQMSSFMFSHSSLTSLQRHRLEFSKYIDIPILQQIESHIKLCCSHCPVCELFKLPIVLSPWNINRNINQFCHVWLKYFVYFICTQTCLRTNFPHDPQYSLIQIRSNSNKMYT